MCRTLSSSESACHRWLNFLNQLPGSPLPVVMVNGLFGDGAGAGTDGAGLSGGTKLRAQNCAGDGPDGPDGPAVDDVAKYALPAAVARYAVPAAEA